MLQEITRHTNKKKTYGKVEGTAPMNVFWRRIKSRAGISILPLSRKEIDGQDRTENRIPRGEDTLLIPLIKGTDNTIITKTLLINSPLSKEKFQKFRKKYILFIYVRKYYPERKDGRYEQSYRSKRSRSPETYNNQNSKGEFHKRGDSP